MKNLKRVLPLFLFVPFGAAAVPPIVIGLLGIALVTAGYSAFRGLVPLNLRQSFEFFSSCWSCDVFSKILYAMSSFIPKAYHAIGTAVIPIAAGLTLVYFAWQIASDYLHLKLRDPWQIAYDVGIHLIKLAVVVVLLAFSLPRFVSDYFIQPIMSVGLSYNSVIRGQIMPEGSEFKDSLPTCIVATAAASSGVPRNQPSNANGQQSNMNDQQADVEISDDGAFSPKLMINMLCQIAEAHRLTGLGMTVGSTILDMSFVFPYSWFFIPNLFYVLLGLILMIMFLWALIPVPIYFLEVFVNLSLNLVMLPLMLLGWLFEKWGLFPGGVKGKGIKGIIDDIVKNTCGIALVGIFIGFALMFLNSMIGRSGGLDALTEAIKNNSARQLMNALQSNNKSLFVLILSGLFIGAFMNAIPNLVTKLFKNVHIPDTEKIQNAVGTLVVNTANSIGNKIKALMGGGESGGGSSGGSGGSGSSSGGGGGSGGSGGSSSGGSSGSSGGSGSGGSSSSGSGAP